MSLNQVLNHQSSHKLYVSLKRMLDPPGSYTKEKQYKYNTNKREI